MSPAAVRKKRDELRARDPDKTALDRPRSPSAEDDAIDAMIKRSIDEFGA